MVNNNMRHSAAQTSLSFQPRLRSLDRRLGSASSSAGTTLDELMTADQVAALLLLPVSTVKDYARRGVLPSIKLGKHRRFVRSAVQAALDDLTRRGQP